jgi:dienelactone hydrolase
MFRAFLAALVTLLAWSAFAAADPSQVDIPGSDVTLHATLYRPDGPGPFPAVVALHDCEGLAQRPAGEGQVYAEWAKLLVGAGFAVLFPDSFGSRGIGPQCREQNRKVRASRERVRDANAARLWLQGQSFIRRDRVSLLGWSNGGTAALWAIRPTAAPRDNSTDFRSAVVLYPGCRRLRETAWSGRVPALILIGSADDWTPAAACQQMVAGARGRSARVEIVVYPGAHHEFDWANSPVRLRTGLVNTVDPSGKAHGGTNPTARNDALKRVPEWLAR